VIIQVASTEERLRAFHARKRLLLLMNESDMSFHVTPLAEYFVAVKFRALVLLNVLMNSLHMILQSRKCSKLRFAA
jgi:hypothetical protein